MCINICKICGKEMKSRCVMIVVFKKDVKRVIY